MARTMAKYTPGPWSVASKPGSDTNHPEFSIESDFGEVASVVTENCDVDEQCAGDARLIAAAPELYSALQLMLEKFESTVQPNEAGWDAIEAARSAIFKVEGK